MCRHVPACSCTCDRHYEPQISFYASQSSTRLQPTTAQLHSSSMTITHGVHEQLFDQQTSRLICIAPRNARQSHQAAQPQTQAQAKPDAGPAKAPSARSNSIWSSDEHERFLMGLELHPKGPWKAVADCVGTKTARQTMSHAQKYRQKIQRRQRGLKPSRVPRHPKTPPQTSTQHVRISPRPHSVISSPISPQPTPQKAGDEDAAYTTCLEWVSTPGLLLPLSSFADACTLASVGVNGTQQHAMRRTTNLVKQGIKRSPRSVSQTLPAVTPTKKQDLDLCLEWSSASSQPLSSPVMASAPSIHSPLAISDENDLVSQALELSEDAMRDMMNTFGAKWFDFDNAP